MSAKFIDTNVVVYLFSCDEPDKRAKATSIVQSNDILISTQVLNEFSNVMFRKFRLNVENVTDACKELTENFDVITVESETIFKALELKGKYGFSYFDSAILASALNANCDILYSEDFQHNQIIEKRLTVINPFI